MTRRKRRSRLPRRLLGASVLLGAAAGLLLVARGLPGSWWGTLGAAGCGVLATLLVGSLLEWVVHSHVMHRPFKSALLRLPYDLHHRGHHWIHYPPRRYLQERVGYVPVSLPARPERAAGTRGERLGAAWGQGLFYTACFGPIAAGLAWLGGIPFGVACGATATALIVLAVHVHDAVHCPGHSPLERLGWFWFLDRHHYIHHLDTRVNVNFLLPWGDALLGTLQLEPTTSQLAQWPTYEEIRTAGAVDATPTKPARELAVT